MNRVLQRRRRLRMMAAGDPVSYTVSSSLFLHYSLENTDWLDDHTGGYTLTPTNTPTVAAGRVNNAASFASASTQYLSRADEAALRLGDTAWSATAWVWLTDKSAIYSAFGKSLATGNQREWQIAYVNSVDRFRFLVSGNGSGNTNLSANTLGSPTVETWYHVYVEHDPVTNLIGISVNNGALDTTAHSTGVFGGTADLTVGSAGGLAPFNGLVDEAAVWTRLLTAAERAWLYNGGTGRAWGEFV